MSGPGQPSRSSIPVQSAAGPNHAGVGDPPHLTDTRNIVIFGEAGAGKSSLVNLIARTNTAVISPDAGGCTIETNEHEILIRNETLKVKLFDTPGLDEGPRGTVPDKEARRILKNLIGTLMEKSDIHLIMYCVRGERVIQTLRRNYKFIKSIVKMRVPIVLVVTCLESYEPEMEEWWRVNERAISKAGMTFAGHACITTAMMTGPKVKERRDRSYIDVCRLIMTARQKIIVVIGETGAGKSSLINLMAGKHVAETSAGTAHCTLHWQEYPIEFDGGSYRVFDTVGLKEPQPEILQFLDAVEIVYKLIQDLERQGGIGLLLLCMRAGGITSAFQTNYRLFHEFLCEKNVPIVLAITNLEREQRMEDWWERQYHTFHQHGIQFAGHACLTTITGNSPHRYESRTTIRKLVKDFAVDGQKQARKGGDNALSFIGKKLGRIFAGNGNSRKDMISCLTKRCGVSRDVAKKLVDRIKKD